MLGQQYENMIENGCLKIGYAQFYRYVNRTNIYLSINISDNTRRYIPFFISIIIDILKKISHYPILSHIIPNSSTGLYDGLTYLLRNPRQASSFGTRLIPGQVSGVGELAGIYGFYPLTHHEPIKILMG